MKSVPSDSSADLQQRYQINIYASKRITKQMRDKVLINTQINKTPKTHLSRRKFQIIYRTSIIVWEARSGCAMWLVAGEVRCKGDTSYSCPLCGRGQKECRNWRGWNCNMPFRKRHGYRMHEPIFREYVSWWIAARETATSVHRECVLQRVLEVLLQDMRDWCFPSGSPSLNPSDWLR